MYNHLKFSISSSHDEQIFIVDENLLTDGETMKHIPSHYSIYSKFPLIHNILIIIILMSITFYVIKFIKLLISILFFLNTVYETVLVNRTFNAMTINTQLFWIVYYAL